MKKKSIYLILLLFSSTIYSQKQENLNQEKIGVKNQKTYSFEAFFRLNSGIWSPESLRRESDSNSSLGNAASNGYLNSYDRPSRDKKFENHGYTSLGFIYKHFSRKLTLDYNYLVYSQYFKMNFKYAGVVGKQGFEQSEIGSAFTYDIHPYRVENKFALTKEIFNNGRFIFGIGGGIRNISIIRERQYPNYIPEYIRYVSSVSNYSNIIKTYGPQISVRSELQLISSLFFRMNVDYFYTQGHAKYNFETVNVNSLHVAKADNAIQFHGFDFNTDISYILFNNFRLFFGYELIVSWSKYRQYNQLSSATDLQTILSSEVQKREYTQNKTDSLQLWYFG
ncbi:LA_2444/LA_4059 family outer membrane protein, partial [Leptospira santarosai]|uniref:LA_2444/LA_4059 family outer membrane protein n=1 Tax=Leptospira santarosai TaxID=28183 RepID=UPI000D1EF3D3